MATVNIGNLTFTHKGDYASGTQYVKNDVVYYSTNGNAYIAKQTTTGNAPTNGTYWSQFAAGSGGIWNAGLSLGSAGQIVKVNSGGNALEFAADEGGKIADYKYSWSNGTQTYNFNGGRQVISGHNLDFGSVLSTSNLIWLTGHIEYGFDGGDPGNSLRWEYSADNSTWYGDKYLSTINMGSSHAGSDAKANWTGCRFFNTTEAHDSSMYHSSLSAIIPVSSLTVAPRYFRVTGRQTDNSNNTIKINHCSGGGYNPMGGSSFNVMVLNA